MPHEHEPAQEESSDVNTQTPADYDEYGSEPAQDEPDPEPDQALTDPA